MSSIGMQLALTVVCLASCSTLVYAEYRQPGIPGIGLAGKWRGLLMTGPNRMRLALDIKRGKIDPAGQSVDEQAEIGAQGRDLRL